MTCQGNLFDVGFFISADGQFVKSAIAEFVFANKLPLVTTFTRESAPAIFESPIKKQVYVVYVCYSVNFETRVKCILEWRSLSLSYWIDFNNLMLSYWHLNFLFSAAAICHFKWHREGFTDI